MKVLLVTFGDDTSFIQGLDSAAKRLESQALISGLFFEVLRFDYNSVRSLPDFELIEPIFSADNWGFGYFVWKPFILNYVLNTYGQTCDYIVYADAGCEIQVNRGKKRFFQSVMRKLELQPVLGYFTEFPEILMTKKDVLNKIMNSKDKFRGNVEATVIYLKSGGDASAFINEWLKLCTKDDYEALMPIRDEISGSNVFQLHCYDQSIFSVIYKNRFNLFLTPIRPRAGRDGEIGLINEFIYSSNFIWPLRNRSGESQLRKQLNSSLISELAIPLFLLYRLLRRVKHFVDPRSKSDKILNLLIPFKERGFFSKR